MCAFQLSRFAWPLFLGCGVGLAVPAAMAAPADVRVVAADPDNPSGSATGVGSQFELTFWQSIAASDDPGQYEAYLAQYPNGTFSALAHAKIAALAHRNSGSGAAAVSPAPPAYEPPAPRAADDDLVRTAEAPDSASVAATPPAPMPPPANTASDSTPCGATSAH